MASKDFFPEDFLLQAIEELVEPKPAQRNHSENLLSISSFLKNNNLLKSPQKNTNNESNNKLSMKNLLKDTQFYNKQENEIETAENTSNSPFFQKNKNSTKSINEFLKTPLTGNKKNSRFNMSSNNVVENFQLKSNTKRKDSKLFTESLTNGFQDKIDIMRQSEFIKLKVISTPVTKKSDPQIDELDEKFEFMLSK